MGKKGFNWKARQVVETKIIQSPNSKIKIELEDKKREKYDECNALILPSKKRETKKKFETPSAKRILTKAQRKKLEKIVERKKKKENVRNKPANQQ